MRNSQNPLCSPSTHLTERGYSLLIYRNQFQIVVLASLVNCLTDGLHTRSNTVCFILVNLLLQSAKWRTDVCDGVTLLKEKGKMGGMADTFNHENDFN